MKRYVHVGAIRKASPVIVGSLVVMVTALTFSIIGSNKHDVKTLIAAILYISGGMIKRRCNVAIIIIIIIIIINLSFGQMTSTKTKESVKYFRHRKKGRSVQCLHRKLKWRKG